MHYENLDLLHGSTAFFRALASLHEGKLLPEAPTGYHSPDRLAKLPANTPLLLGFSGGVDSSVLLFLTAHYAKTYNVPLRLVHLHHGIRGKEADRDADFAKHIADLYGLPLSLVYKNIPAIAEKSGESIEAAARRTRYEVFEEIMREYNIPVLLTAHNADDHLETVLFHFLRGSGLSGLCGIPPVRQLEHGTVLRPLLETPRSAIEAFAKKYEIPFVFDSTNGDIAYTRNRIRKEIVPRLREISDAPEKAAVRLSASLRKDKEYFDSEASALLSRADTENGLDRATLKDAPDSILLRTLLLYWQKNIPSLDSYESIHLDALLSFVKTGRNGTRLSLRKATAYLENGCLRILPVAKEEPDDTPSPDFKCVLSEGENKIPALGLVLFFGTAAEAERYLTEKKLEKIDENAKNIYNSATQIRFSFDTIEERLQNAPLCVRLRLPGDRILFRGMHRSLRTLFNEAHIPQRERGKLPVITLGDEILWIPGLALRDGICMSPANDFESDNTKVLVLISKKKLSAFEK